MVESLDEKKNFRRRPIYQLLHAPERRLNSNLCLPEKKNPDIKRMHRTPRAALAKAAMPYPHGW